MSIISDKQAEELFTEAFKYRDLMNQLSGYELKKIRAVTDTRIQSEVNSIMEMVNIPVSDYNYPDDLDETKLFEYWAGRTNGGLYNKLKIFEAELDHEINKRNDQPIDKPIDKQPPDDLSLNDQFDWIDNANISKLDITKYVENQTGGRAQLLSALLEDLNIYAMARFVDDEYEQLIYEKGDIISMKVANAGCYSWQDGWDYIVEIVELDKHINLIWLKRIIEDQLKRNSPEEHQEHGPPPLNEPQQVMKKYVGRKSYRPGNRGLPEHVICSVMQIAKDYIESEGIKNMDGKVNHVAKKCNHLDGHINAHSNIIQYYATENGRLMKPEASEQK